MSGGMSWPAVGVVGGAEASRQHSRPQEAGVGGPTGAALRLEQEDQRLKKHDGRWIDIQRLRLLESFVDVYNN